MRSKDYVGEDLFVGKDAKGRPYSHNKIWLNRFLNEDVEWHLKNWNPDISVDMAKQGGRVAVEMLFNAGYAFSDVVKTGLSENDTARLTLELRPGVIGLRMTNLADAFHAGRGIEHSRRLMALDKPARADLWETYWRREHQSWRRRAVDENGIKHNRKGYGANILASVCDVFRITAHPLPDHYPPNLCEVRTIAAIRLPR